MPIRKHVYFVSYCYRGGLLGGEELVFRSTTAELDFIISTPAHMAELEELITGYYVPRGIACTILTFHHLEEKVVEGE